MKMKHISISQDVLAETFTNASAAMLEQPAYGQLATRTRVLHDSLATVQDQKTRKIAQDKTLATPAIAFLVDTTLDTLEQPEITGQLPIDAYRRAIWAMEVAENYADLAADTGLFRDFYRQNSHLNDVTPPKVLKLLGDAKYLTAYGVAPFRETCCVAGGAVRAMRAWVSGKRRPEMWQEFDLDPTMATEVVMRSTGLQIAASLDSATANKNVTYLGRPYASTSHFEPSVACSAPVVRFAPRTLRHLGSLLQKQEPQRGCPVRKIASDEPGTTVLAASWSRIVHTIVPPEARVQIAPTPVPLKRVLWSTSSI